MSPVIGDRFLHLPVPDGTFDDDLAMDLVSRRLSVCGRVAEPALLAAVSMMWSRCCSMQESWSDLCESDQRELQGWTGRTGWPAMLDRCDMELLRELGVLGIDIGGMGVVASGAEAGSWTPPEAGATHDLSALLTSTALAECSDDLVDAALDVILDHDAQVPAATFMRDRDARLSDHTLVAMGLLARRSGIDFRFVGSKTYQSERLKRLFDQSIRRWRQ